MHIGNDRERHGSLYGAYSLALTYNEIVISIDAATIHIVHGSNDRTLVPWQSAYDVLNRLLVNR